MEDCALVNRALAEEFFIAAYGARNQKSPDTWRKTEKKIAKICAGRWASSHARSGDGSINDIFENECFADEYHSAAARILGIRSKRETIPEISTQAPTYCKVEDRNPYGCAYVNRLIAIDFFRRASSSTNTANGHSPEPMLEAIDAACTTGLSAGQGGEVDSEVQRLQCICVRLHQSATQMLR